MNTTRTTSPSPRRGVGPALIALAALVCTSAVPAGAESIFSSAGLWFGQGEGGQDPVSARVIGIDSRAIACRNVNTGQTVTGSLPDVALDESFDCESLGLLFDEGDLVILQIEGVNFGGPALNGEATGLEEGALVTCTNLATDQDVTVRVLEGVWDCLNADIELVPMDPVLVRIQGLTLGASQAPPPAAVTFTLTGMDSRTVVCRNNTDPQDVTGVLEEVALEETIDCLALGLTVTSGDEVAIQSNGRNFGNNLTATFVGIATGIAGKCENRTTGESVAFAVADGESAFDCVAEGLVITNQDDVTVTVRGNVP